MSSVVLAGVVLVVLVAVHVPLGNYLAWVFTSERHWRVERVFYRLIRVDSSADQRWPHYAMSLLAFSVVSILALFALLRLQPHLPMSQGKPAMPADQSFNTSVSFVTNTSWQSYAGEKSLGNLAQMAGIALQAFLSTVVGLAVAMALIRGLARRGTDRVGNFWVDMTRGLVRVLLPLSFLFGLVLLGAGVIQSLSAGQDATTLVGGTQFITGGPVASYEPIKVMSGDGGGFFNVGSAHPFENPTALTNLIEIVLMLLVPSALPRAYGRMVGDRRQGWAVAGVMAVLLVGGVVATMAVEAHGQDTTAIAAGQPVKGKETRFGVGGSALFGAAATTSSDGAANSSYDSYTPLAGGMLLFNMLLDEVGPGGIGSGLYGLLVFALFTVFLAGLMIGRTPEFLGKRVARREVTLVALYLLVYPLCVLIGAALSLALPTPRGSISQGGPHGLSQILYAFTSGSATNGSAFAGLTSNTAWYNTGIGLVMLLGRYVPMLLVLALAGTLGRQRPVPVSAGTLPTYRPLFASMLTGVVIIVGGLSYFPALALGPLAEGLT
ncbi:MAG: potassium-transporting ATPase subunit KdpA [Frankiaceae bacterium]